MAETFLKKLIEQKHEKNMLNDNLKNLPVVVKCKQNNNSVPQQRNSYDCGVYVCIYADYISQEIYEFSIDPSLNLREKLLYRLVFHERYFWNI